MTCMLLEPAPYQGRLLSDRLKFMSPPPLYYGLSDLPAFFLDSVGLACPRLNSMSASETETWPPKEDSSMSSAFGSCIVRKSFLSLEAWRTTDRELCPWC